MYSYCANEWIEYFLEIETMLGNTNSCVGALRWLDGMYNLQSMNQ